MYKYVVTRAIGVVVVVDGHGLRSALPTVAAVPAKGYPRSRVGGGEVRTPRPFLTHIDDNTGTPLTYTSPSAHQPPKQCTTHRHCIAMTNNAVHPHPHPGREER